MDRIEEARRRLRERSASRRTTLLDNRSDQISADETCAAERGTRSEERVATRARFVISKFGALGCLAFHFLFRLSFGYSQR